MFTPVYFYFFHWFKLPIYECGYCGAITRRQTLHTKYHNQGR